MKTPAYQKSYLNNAQSTLGNIFDYAINDCNYDPDIISQYFLISGIGKQFSKGNPKYIVGKSGIEIFNEIVEFVTHNNIFTTPLKQVLKHTRSKEYWAGWILAYFQWYTSKSFNEIFSKISLCKIIDMYNPYHETDPLKFIDDVLNAYFSKQTNLKIFRNLNKLTQQELATLSKTSLRSIQMYEQKYNNINKAQVLTLFNISKILNCSIEDLID